MVILVLIKNFMFDGSLVRCKKERKKKNSSLLCPWDKEKDYTGPMQMNCYGGEGSELELHLWCIFKCFKVCSHGLVHWWRTTPQNLQFQNPISLLIIYRILDWSKKMLNTNMFHMSFFENTKTNVKQLPEYQLLVQGSGFGSFPLIQSQLRHPILQEAEKVTLFK